MSLGPGWIFWIKDPKQRNMDMRFGTWNVWSLYRVGSLITVEGTVQIEVRFSGSAGGQMGGQWHHTSRGIHIFLWKVD
jgi:hypothetical protein